MDEAPVQGLWIGPRLSTMQQLTIRSFLANGHPFHLFVYEDVTEIPRGTTVLDARAVLPESEICTYRGGFGAGSPSLFSNIFRYRLLLDRGGYWSDLDMVCLRPLRFPEPYVFGRQVRDDGSLLVNCALMKAPAGAPVIQRCWDRVAALDRRAIRWGQTGPLLIDEAVTACGLEPFVRPTDAFYPIGHQRVAAFLTNLPIPEDSHCVHLWGALWKHHGMDPDAIYPRDALYERLKSRYAL